MKISARNQLKGSIVDVVKGATTSHIRIDIGGGVIVTSSITNEAVDEVNLAVGRTKTWPRAVPLSASRRGWAADRAYPAQHSAPHSISSSA